MSVNYVQIINNNKNIFLFISELFDNTTNKIFNLEDIIQIKYFTDIHKINYVNEQVLFTFIETLYKFDECSQKYIQLIIQNKLNILYNQIKSKL